HGDIKPRNVKLDADGRPILLDFGLARHSRSQSRVAGYTLDYAPLEQIRGDAIDARSDLYGLGATLYELLARRAPPDAVRRAAAIVAGEPDPLVPLHRLNASVPSAVSAVIGQALAVYANARPSSSLAMQLALRDAQLGGHTVIVEPPVAPTFRLT